MDDEKLLELAEANKEPIFVKLLELALRRVARIDRAALKGKTTEEVLELFYLQGVAEALDAFGVAELVEPAGRNVDEPLEC